MEPLVLVPGLLCDAALWREQDGALHDRQVHVADIRGVDSIAEMGRQVLTRAPQRFALAGHSLGGRVALEIIRQAPDRVTGLALLDTGVHPVAAGEAERRAALLERARSHGLRVIAEDMLIPAMHPSRRADDQLVRDVIAMLERSTIEDLVNQFRAMLTRPDARPLLARITCPTLVLCGREDTYSPLARHEEMAQAIPNARLVIVDECGHMAPMEQPEAVTRALQEWLSK